MIYLDNGATSFRKPPSVMKAVQQAFLTCANPGRGGYTEAIQAAKTVFACREKAAAMFSCLPEQVVFTSNCTHGLNIAIHSLVKPGGKVVISGFEHNAVTRPLYGLGAEVSIAGRKLFDWDDTLNRFSDALKPGVDAAVFTHVSNAFGYILPVEQMAALCRERHIPFVIDTAQSAGILPLDMQALGAEFIAMPGHKGLLGPQGTGILLSARPGEPLLRGGTGSESRNQAMPDFLPDRLEAGTVNVPGIAGLGAGLDYLLHTGVEKVGAHESALAAACARALEKLGMKVFAGPHQSGTVSFVPQLDCEVLADALGQQGIALRAGLHCAPLAHESAGTLDSGTVRVSFGYSSHAGEIRALIRAVSKLSSGKR